MLRRWESLIPNGVDKISIVIVADRTIARLSGMFLGRAHATDVLSFPPDEVIISIDTAIRQAKERSVPLLHELVLLAVHGIHHLRGLTDETCDGWKAMRVAEFETLMRIF